VMFIGTADIHLWSAFWSDLRLQWSR